MFDDYDEFEIYESEKEEDIYSSDLCWSESQDAYVPRGTTRDAFDDPDDF